ncbi:MAG: carbohydrate-binding module family 20 domain-containing protein [Anaerolineaceae bacterium]
MTVLTTLGDHKYTSQEVSVNPDETSPVNFELEAAKKVLVTFNVETPADTPNNASVKLSGNVFQMGLYPDSELNYGFTRWSPSRQILMEAVSENSFTTTVELYEGSYIQYDYTLVGYPDLGDEKTSSGESVFRSFIVGTKDETRDESIAAWKNPNQFALTFNVTVPANTPSDAIVYIDLGGPYLAMDRVSEKQWTLTFFEYPDNTFNYRYFHSNGPMEMELFEPDDTNTYRTVTVANGDTTLNDTVAQWKWYPAVGEAGAGAPINVTFRVTVPLNTPTEDTIYLVGDSVALGSGQDDAAVPMTQVATNPWLWEATVPFDATTGVTYHYTRGDSATSESETRTLNIAYNGQTANDAVVSWADLPNSVSRDFISAIYPDDLWDPAYLSLYESTLSRIQSLGADTIVLSSVWSYGQVDPLPEIESRPIKAYSVFTPTEDLITTVEMAHSVGMKVFILPQFNMEMTAGGETIGEAHSNEWWDQWLLEAEKFYLYNAKIAEQTGAEMLLLPGPVFQAFPGKSGFEDGSYISVFDQKMMDLIGEVREQYSGLILISGAQSSLYDFPGLADYVIITPFDMGTDLNVSSNASVQQIKSAFERILDKKASPIFEKYNKPVLVQITYPSVDGAADGALGDAPWDVNDPSTVVDVIEQANIYEGFFQAVLDRPWIAGTFDYSYHYFDLSEDETPSIRAKPAEAVVSKYYRAFEQQ